MEKKARVSNQAGWPTSKQQRTGQPPMSDPGRVVYGDYEDGLRYLCHFLEPGVSWTSDQASKPPLLDSNQASETHRISCEGNMPPRRPGSRVTTVETNSNISASMESLRRRGQAPGLPWAPAGRQVTETCHLPADLPADLPAGLYHGAKSFRVQ
jgi:hypothetical protein